MDYFKKFEKKMNADLGAQIGAAMIKLWPLLTTQEKAALVIAFGGPHYMCDRAALNKKLLTRELKSKLENAIALRQN